MIDNELKLNEIKGLADIPDNSIFIFSALVFLALVLLFLLVLFIIKLLKNRKKDLRKEYFEILENLDFKDPKQSAYIITKYARLLAKNEREQKIANELIEELEEYKYKKEVDTIEEKTKAKLSTFMDIVDV
ncbi:hypothetical protein [Arcobacter roscoffensis]|uniref:DUF4381 domain-containing protein n=1 Tax=Arcobacter roscoffensis TaxID=2961520 RepID=A0ABY5E4S8_9BACT|nr:hypothetical protein [Arcobacter roscoffensis]UTJ07159.1 hypothetical protein NJU99_03460 [Arcobacter roscoffensis]